MIEVLSNYHDAFLHGVLTTLRLCGIVWSIGLVAGVMLGVAGARYRSAIGLPTRFVAFILSGIPVLVLLFWLHYPAQALLRVIIDPFITAAVTLSLVNMFVVSGIVREAIVTLPRQYIDAATVCGISKPLAARRIVLPMIARHVLPPLVLTQVTMLHATLFASLISVDETFRVAQRVNSIEYRPVAIYSAVALLFLALSLPLSGLAMVLQRRYGREWSER